MNRSFLFLLAISIFLFACSKKEESQAPIKIVFFTDSTFTVKKDSIEINSLNNSLHGFVKIYGYGGINSFEEGELKDGKHIGIWKKYFYGTTLSEYITFNQLGERDGVSLEFDSNGDTLSLLNFRKNHPIGKQKEFYKGKLTLQYFIDSNDHLINKFLALKPNGDTLYFVDLGKKGTGYLKKYDRYGVLNIEGYLKNGSFQDTIKEYFYDNFSNKYLYANVYFYKDDSTKVFIKKINMN
ncbi:hypothetical protein ETU08_04310 [Apibacter muscae]|uniref:hypothetical protein n=1 Tax=Apibacter muscae TaxID=2509004 RepID=UPI0011ABF7F6|nr:hypothetical protein [Apibacter muscae]TWP30321.1 hypothetical protein ETU08_04310 [Apibacter muscae]